MSDYSEYQEMRKEMSENLINDFANLVNGGADIDAILNRFRCQHRTLQQSMMNVLMRLICYIGSPEYLTDGRNEYSKKLAQDLIKGYGNLFEEKEYQYYISQGYNEETAREKAQKNRKSFDDKPSDYLSLPLI